MSKYHVALLRGYDAQKNSWQAQIDWSQGLVIHQIACQADLLPLEFSLQGTALEHISLEKASWLPGIESCALMAYLHLQEEEKMYKARFYIQVGEGGLSLALEHESSALDCLGWKVKGEVKIQKNTSWNLTLPIGLVKSDYALFLTRGQLEIEGEEREFSLMTPKAYQGLATLEVGRYSS